MAKKTQKKARVHKSFILRLCIFAFVAYAAVMLVEMQVSLANRKQEAEALTQQLELQRLENKELERQLAAGIDKDYVERVAREELDYVYPEWRVYIDISGS